MTSYNRRARARLRERLRRRLGLPRITFEVEGRGVVKPWAVRAGMLVVETRWTHDTRHLRLVLRLAGAVDLGALVTTEAGARAIGQTYLAQSGGDSVTISYLDPAGTRRAVDVHA